MYTFFHKALALLRSEDGPTATEYAVLLGVIAIGVLGAMSAFGMHVDNIYTTLTSSVDDVF